MRDRSSSTARAASSARSVSARSVWSRRSLAIRSRRADRRPAPQAIISRSTSTTSPEMSHSGARHATTATQASPHKPPTTATRPELKAATTNKQNIDISRVVLPSVAAVGATSENITTTPNAVNGEARGYRWFHSSTTQAT